MLEELGVPVAPAERGLGQHEVAGAASTLGLEVVDGGGSVDGFVARPVAVAALRERPASGGTRCRAGRRRRRTATSTTSPGRPIIWSRRRIDRGRVRAATAGEPRRVSGPLRAGAARADHLLDDLAEAALDEIEAVTVVDVRGAGRDEPAPQIVVGEQTGDPGGEVGRVDGDERVLALDEVEALGTDGCRDHRRARHHRLDHLALHARAVQQRHDREARPLDVGLHRRHPADEPNPRSRRVDVECHAVEPVADAR